MFVYDLFVHETLHVFRACHTTCALHMTFCCMRGMRNDAQHMQHMSYDRLETGL